jgi:alkanesulfonate monooxygenase SsuD/methylene tetrahydromethanopterin reductase-like flavin-dependent oxidoreductase (luciferase family)
MQFNHFLTSYLPDAGYGAARLYRDMIEQAVHAERVGYAGVSIPEHHLINILMIPSPLQMAVKIATLTSSLEIVTAVAVLPIRDMRVFAGEVIQAQILCDDRLVLGVGRGAFAYELARLGVPIETTREKFDESLAVLEALLGGEEVSWSGKYYQFEHLTVMPRPSGAPVPIMMAAMAPDAIHASAARGYSIQTTPLEASHEVLLGQVDAFKSGQAKAGLRGKGTKLSLQRVAYAARDERDARDKLERAHEYYKRFDNVFRGPGEVASGMIAPLPRQQTVDELAGNVMICPASEMVDRLGAYAEAGIDEVIMSSNFAQPQAETLEMMQRMAEDVMPHLVPRAKRAIA